MVLNIVTQSYLNEKKLQKIFRTVQQPLLQLC